MCRSRALDARLRRSRSQRAKRRQERGDIGMQKLGEPYALIIERHFDSRGFDDALKIDDAVGLTPLLARDGGAADSLEEKIVLAVGQLLVSENLAETDDRLDGGL